MILFQKPIKRTIKVNNRFYRLQFPYIVFHNEGKDNYDRCLRVGFCRGIDFNDFVSIPCLPNINANGEVCMHYGRGHTIEQDIDRFWNSTFCVGHWNITVYTVLNATHPELTLPKYVFGDECEMRSGQRGIIEQFFEQWEKTDNIDTILSWCFAITRLDRFTE